MKIFNVKLTDRMYASLVELAEAENKSIEAMATIAFATGLAQVMLDTVRRQLEDVHHGIERQD